MFGAILTATNSSFQKCMACCRSIYVKKVMKLLAFIFEQPSYVTLLHQIGDNREGSEQLLNVDRKSLEFSICRQSGKQTAIQKVCF